ncbi:MULTISPECIES: glycosyltransferase family 1 protein [unclassified Fibrobacter]|uniref:glycosyltransferase family 1 protein n=1 Tax=unclassified Fibrobacter TaxID=2634177 RepID=UPI000D6B9EE7|nr:MULTISPECIES: glycosyltransferase family 1 protein [unclassified Fibrobacter]PWJ55903.1 glycosyltransferase involved in cell wall biosynthesis [Fibrobacter sp. UWR4]PZW61974.1 glycosyltransferase involved in cell wall biosynthesis [Fibrobacter sp. UWR1]
MKIMIFETVISGHVLEWIHHIYEYASKEKNEYVFVLPPTFKDEQSRLTWSHANNIEFAYLSDIEVVKCTKGGLLKTAYEASRIIQNYVKLFRADELFLIFLMKTIPFLPFFLPSNVKVSGVLYRIYLYDSTKAGFRLFLEKIRYWILAKSKTIKNVFVLNDENVPSKFNHKYRTNKFIYLPDPLPQIDGPFYDLRNELGIPSLNKIFFQFGTIDKRKNSLTILEACLLMSEEECSDKTLIFSGRFDPTIKDEFCRLVSLLRNKMQVIILEGFISYQQLNNLCFTTDYIMTLYDNVCQSSGTIGYSAFFGKCVIGPSNGLLGDLIIKNKLGVVINQITPETVKQVMLSPIEKQQTTYISSHSVDDFCKVLFK